MHYFILNLGSLSPIFIEKSNQRNKAQNGLHLIARTLGIVYGPKQMEGKETVDLPVGFGQCDLGWELHNWTLRPPLQSVCLYFHSNTRVPAPNLLENRAKSCKVTTIYTSSITSRSHNTLVITKRTQILTFFAGHSFYHRLCDRYQPLHSDGRNVSIEKSIRISHLCNNLGLATHALQDTLTILHR